MIRKEKYFTTEKIDEQAKKILEKIRNEIPQKPFEILSTHCALLILDMQDYFLNEDSHAFVPSAEAIIKPVNKLIDTFAEKNLTVIYTCHMNSEYDAGMMLLWWKDLLTENSRLSSLSDKLHIKNGTIINKPQYDAFFNSPLAEILIDKHIKQLIITGVMTHLCCESTARSGFVKGYEIFIPVDATATYNKDIHFSSLRNASHGFAHVISSTEIINSISK